MKIIDLIITSYQSFEKMMIILCYTKYVIQNMLYKICYTKYVIQNMLYKICYTKYAIFLLTFLNMYMHKKTIQNDDAKLSSFSLKISSFL